MNTNIEYLYRDGSNEKIWNNCVIPGEITEEQKSAILDSLYDGENFIPSAVGMSEERFSKWDWDVDHPFFELGEFSFSLTDKKPTLDITPEELTASFLACADKWEELGVNFYPDDSYEFDEEEPLEEEEDIEETKPSSLDDMIRDAQSRASDSQKDDKGKEWEL